MAESDARVDLFLEDIDHDAIDRRNAAEAEVDQYIRSQLASEEEKAKRQADAAILDCQNRLRIEANKKFAAVHNTAKAQLSARRIAMKEEVFSLAGEKLRQFTATPDYAAFLKQSVTAMADQITGEAVILVREADLPLAESLRAAFGRDCAVEADRSIRLGGCKIQDRTNGLIADDTLEVRLSAQNEWFLANAALTVNDAEEVG